MLKIMLSFCLIAKNEEKYLPQLLKSVENIVDEIIIVDTGSTDKTKEIGKKFGANVFDFEWSKDFSVARNFSIDQAAGDWVMIMNPDEKIGEKDKVNLKSLLVKEPKKAYVFTTRNYFENSNVPNWNPWEGEYPEEEEGRNCWVGSDEIRLFPNHPKITFHFPVHEIISEEDCIKCGHKPEKTDIPIHHYGSKKDKSGQEEKNNLYLELGLQKVKEEAQNPEAFFQLARQYANMGNEEKAIEWSLKCLEFNPNHGDCNYSMGKVLSRKGDLLSAKKHLEIALNSCEDQAGVNLAMGELLQKESKWNVSISFLENSMKLKPHPHVSFLLARSLFFLNQIDKSAPLLMEALRKDPNNPDAHFFMGNIFFKIQKWEESKKAFLKTLELDPKNGKAHTFLGAVLAIQNQDNEAVVHFEEALKLNPDDVDSLANLGIVYAKKGRNEEAFNLLEKGLNLQPSNESIKKNIEKIQTQLDRSKE